MHQTPDIHDLLKRYWGYDAFRPLQEEIIHAVLQGQDTLALLPTGGGKSICFQVPALAREGLCLVISPLIALMKDQVENLRRKGITAFAIYSGMTRKEVIQTLKVATDSNCKFLYVSPERLETTLFREYLPALDINLVAVDEAHCISQWGYDFRPPYLRIAALREELPGVPVLALTASATPEVQEDICQKLLFPQKNILRRSFARPNLSYSLFRVEARFPKMLEVLQKVPGSSIVYCKSRKRTQEFARLLQAQGISADFYHAGLPGDERNRRQEAWIRNATRVMVCTNAFGMGIDKPDVRTVVHAEVPDNLENYYQEAGRAGRDGKKAYAVLLYQAGDPGQLQRLPDIHFPTIDTIREVYQALVNYLQIPAGGGQGNSYDFDLNDFLKKFRLNVHSVIYSIGALEQEGLISFNEQIFLPAKVSFVAGKKELYAFEETHPELEPLIKALLRNYEGIFDQPTAISEKTLAWLLKQEQPAIVADLQRLHGQRVIVYEPQKDSPQLYFIQNRVKAASLQIENAHYEKRKQRYTARIGVMLDYIKTESQCRSRFIAAYFGDTELAPCGICDNCLRLKNSRLPAEEFEAIHQLIITALREKNLQSRELLAQCTGVRREKLWKVIDFLQSEDRLRVDEDGRIQLK